MDQTTGKASSQYGAAARGEVDERAKEVSGGGREGALCITLNHPWAPEVH